MYPRKLKIGGVSSTLSVEICFYILYPCCFICLYPKLHYQITVLRDYFNSYFKLARIIFEGVFGKLILRIDDLY